LTAGVPATATDGAVGISPGAVAATEFVTAGGVALLAAADAVVAKAGASVRELVVGELVDELPPPHAAKNAASVKTDATARARMASISLSAERTAVYAPKSSGRRGRRSDNTRSCYHLRR
jgi:hypothetical protein